MPVWEKKAVDRAQVESLQKRYGIDALTASILLRRNIVDGKDLLYYMEDDLRFQHNPFTFTYMEDAVDRILAAREEKEKVLIFGDRDVDGVSATTVLYDCLEELGLDIQFKLPGGDDAYGLSMAAVDDFARDNGTLIITVDCGISNNAEVAHAGELGIDVIIVDHHNPQENLPEPAIIINPKCEDSGYAFHDISGCAVVFKLVSAIRFSKSKWYKQQTTLVNVLPDDECYTIECIKLRNLVPVSRIREPVIPQTVSISETRLPAYLSGELLLVWNEERIKKLLSDCFGNVDFNLLDLRPKISAFIPSFKSLELAQIKLLSKIAKYGNHEATETGSFYNIYVTYVQMALKKEFPSIPLNEEKDLQLVALAALADIMPMKNENRIFVKKGIEAINAGHVRSGLKELMASLNMLDKHLASTDMSWTLVSNLNAAGRLGHPELAAELFISKDASRREKVAMQIKDLNAERKQLSQDACGYADLQAKASIPLHNNKLCVAIDERINRGVNGIVAGRLCSTYNIPAITVTFVGDNATGSMRSCRGCDATVFLNKMKDIFLNYGGHTYAAGFSFERRLLDTFTQRLKELSADITLDELSTKFEVDAEIPAAYLTPDLLKLTDRFEPFGEGNPQLLFMSKRLPVYDAILLGKGEKLHLKIIVGNDKFKWPALFWNEGERLHRDFEIGDKVDILFHVERNTFNGIETPQLILIDLQKSKEL